MASSINKVTLLGHLGDVVKMHYFEGGGSVGRFPVATNEEYTNRATGEKVTTTEWHNIVVRNKLAELCETYLAKGDRVYIEGRLKTRQWQDDAGNKHYNTEVHAIEIVFLSPKKQSDVSNSPENIQKQDQTTPNTTEEKEDDLPF